MLLSLNPPNLSRRDFLQNASHGVQIQIGDHAYQITKVIYKVTNSHLLFALFLSAFGNAIVTFYARTYVVLFSFSLSYDDMHCVLIHNRLLSRG